MKSMVVFFALAAVACGSLVPLAQPPHHPALVLDPHGRPLDTAEVINARALHLQAKALEGHYAHSPLAYSVAPVAHSVLAPAVVAAPAAVSHQSRVDVHSSPAVIAHASPVYAHGYSAPLLAHSALGLAGHGHYLKKRSLAHYAYSAPIIAPSAVSHQSRVDIVSSPAVVSHAVAAPVIAHAPVVAHAIAPAAVSHQSRVDVHSSPAIVSHSVVATPAHYGHSILSAPVYGAHAGYSFAHGHLLKKRSLAHILAPVAHAIAPSAVSHQSRVDVISSPAVVSHEIVAPVAIAHAAPIAVAHAPAVSHQSRVDYVSSPAHYTPLAHSAIWSAPAAHSYHSALLHSSPSVYAAQW